MSIRLTWKDASSNETGFELTRETQQKTDWVSLVVFNIPANVSSYDDDIKEPGTYRYKIRAVNASGASDWTPFAQATIPEPIPAAPTDLVATLI